MPEVATNRFAQQIQEQLRNRLMHVRSVVDVAKALGCEAPRLYAFRNGGGCTVEMLDRLIEHFYPNAKFTAETYTPIGPQVVQSIPASDAGWIKQPDGLEHEYRLSDGVLTGKRRVPHIAAA